MTAMAVLAVVGVLMVIEWRVSVRNERALRARGAREPPDDVHRWMRLAYPGGFMAMAGEGIVRGAAADMQLLAGGVVFLAAKTLKYWSIASLGPYWSFRVLVVPGAPLVQHGPYRFARHPNYIAVIGELVGAALLFDAPAAGTIATLLFAELIRRRVAVEERALLNR